MTGIYCITNTVTGKRYVGKSVDIESRFSEHIRELVSGNHFNLYLQRSWNKYGRDCFSFNVLEECDEQMLNEREIYWIQHFGGYKSDALFNLAEGGSGGRMSPEVVEKRAKSISKARQLTPAGTYSGSHNSMFGKHHSEATKAVLRQKCRHTVNPMQGRHHSDETKLKISRANSGRVLSAEVRSKISAGVKQHLETHGVRPRASKYSEQFKASLREEYRSGKTFRQIADEHNLSYEVCRLLIKYNRTGVREGDEQSIV